MIYNTDVYKESELWSLLTVGPVTRTTGIPAYSRLKPLAVNGAGHPADEGRMLA